jgi:hypothetical protein
MSSSSILMIVTFVALILGVLNWLLFAFITFRHDLPLLDRLARPALGNDVAGARGLADGEKLLEGAGTLAGAFRRAGAAPTAAAMSLVCLVIATIAAGVERL